LTVLTKELLKLIVDIKRVVTQNLSVGPPTTLIIISLDLDDQKCKLLCNPKSWEKNRR